MIRYKSSTNFQPAAREWRNSEFCTIKRQREDFNDMFNAEYKARLSAGDLSLVFVLTYNEAHVHYQYGRNVLDADDLKCFSKASKFAKRLSRTFGYTFDFVCVGEYGNGGESHDYKGKRGKGNNPHFHCVGWFHKEFDTDAWKDYMQEIGIKYVDIYDAMCKLVRVTWQGDTCNDAKIYGRNVEAQKRGLGFVKLDGSIRSAHNGGSYISKYLGKDIRKTFLHEYFGQFLKHFEQIAIDAIYEKKVEYFQRTRHNMPDFDYDDIYKYWLRSRRHDIVEFKKCREIVRFDSAVSSGTYFGECFGDIFEHLDDMYITYYNEFGRDINGRFSPKVRKFHGFGYALLDECDKIKGTYNGFNPKRGAYTRILPPSLQRNLYYSYKVVKSLNPLAKSAKCVKYFLKPIGVQHLRYTLSKMVDTCERLCKNSGVPSLVENAYQVANAKLISAYDMEIETFDNYFPTEDSFISLVQDRDACINFAIAQRSVFALESSKEDRVFIQFDKVVSSCIMADMRILDDMLEIYRQKHDRDAEIWLSAWQSVYNSKY